MRIDSHQHFWSIERPNDYGFLVPESGILYSNFLPEDLRPHLAKQGIDYTILVQAAETLEETEWLLDLSINVDFVAGVVGWINFDTNSKEFSNTLERLRRHRKFIGVRPMLQELEDDNFILRQNVINNLKIVASEDFPFDLLVYPRHLPFIVDMLERVPGLRVVVDHIAKPSIKDDVIDLWLTWMEKISQFPNVWCKLSGMVTEADHRVWKKEDFIPYVQAVVRSFGSNRLMFGSDWPVCLQAASYEEVYNLLKDILIDNQNIENQTAIYGENAAKFYKLSGVLSDYQR